MFRGVIISGLLFAACSACSSSELEDRDAAVATDTGTVRQDAEAMDRGSQDAEVMDASEPRELGFFVTSQGTGALAGNLGGLMGADAKCQMLATLAGAGGRTWRAYLSATGVNARDRIGTGPWYNAAGTLIAADVASLHATPPPYTATLDENGDMVPLMEHDILTGSTPEGMTTGSTCNDWTDSTGNSDVWVGHSNWDDPIGAVTSWSSAHTASCVQADFNAKYGTGRIYCFAL